MGNKTTEKWNQAGLLGEGLSESQQDTLALGLENQAIWMLQNEQVSADLLLPLARSVMLKIMDSLVTVPFPAFLDENEESAVVATVRYGVLIQVEELKNPTPNLVESLATSMAQSLLAQKGDKSRIYLYTPVILFSMTDLACSAAYRAVFR